MENFNSLGMDTQHRSINLDLFVTSMPSEDCLALAYT